MTTRLPAFRQVFRQLVLLGLRGAGMAAKLALSLYMVRYLGLADVGFYGLLIGATTATPALLGFGLTAWIMRKLVNLPAAQAIPAMFTRLSLSLLIQLIVQPLVWTADVLLGEPVPLHLAPAIATILLLESLASEVYSMLTALRRIRLAEALLFIRSGLWPLPVIVYGLIEPSARTLDVVLYGWLAGVAVTWLITAAQLLPQQRWRHLALQWRWLFDGARESVPLYLHDINLAFSLYLDRFLISLFLGLELTGVYTFFWSVANMVHALTVFGVITPQIATLVDAGRRTAAEFARVVRRLQIETVLWAALLAGGAAAAVVILLPFLNRPLLGDNLHVFWIIMAATLLRVCSDGYGYVLYARKRDDAIAATSIAGTVISAALNLVLVPFASIRGAAIAFLLTALAQFGMRYQLSRSAPDEAIAVRAKTAV